MIIFLLLMLLPFNVLAEEIEYNNTPPLPTEYYVQPFDVLHYDVYIDLTASPTRNTNGVCKITVCWLDKKPENKFYFHLRGLEIDSCFYEDILVEPIKQGTINSADFHWEIAYQEDIENDTITVTIYYSGIMTQELGTYAWGGIQSRNGILYSLGVGFTCNYVSTTQHWFPCYDHPSDKATFKASFLVNEGKSVASNGSLTIEELDEGKSLYVWEHNYPVSTYMLTFAVGNYQEIVIADDPLPIVVYALEKDREAVDFTFNILPRTVVTYSRLYGEYPFEKVGYVLTPTGSMEHQTMISLDERVTRKDFANQDSINIIGAHELAHQWFGGLVTPKDFRDTWLNESFATFSESVWLEELYGPYAYLAHQSRKINEYILTLSKMEGILPIYDYPRASPSSNFPTVIYYKGAAVVGLLRYKLGDELFFQIIRDYLEQYSFSVASTQDFKDVLEETSGIDFSQFFEQWIYGIGWPQLEIDIAYDFGKATIEVSQIQAKSWGAYIDFPLEIEVFSANDYYNYILDINDVNETFNFDSFPLPDSIKINSGLSVRVPLEIMKQSFTSVESDKINNLKIYPIPAKEMINIEFEAYASNALVQIVDVNGKAIFSQNKYLKEGNNQLSFDVSTFADGFYYITINTTTTQFSQRFLKLN